MSHLQGHARRALELWALAASVALAALAAFYSVRLAWQSRLFNDVSTSSDATPLWIPQLAMAVGSVVLLIALADEWWLEWHGQRQHTTPDEALHNE